MSQELETGPYFISSVSFETGRPVIRYLGASNDHPNTIVVLPIGSPPPIWNITKLDDNTHAIFLNGKIAAVLGGLVLTPARILFSWRILRGAPSPPPIGNNSFGIIVPGSQPQESWFIGNTGGDPAVEVPVILRDIASSIVIFPDPKDRELLVAT